MTAICKTCGAKLPGKHFPSFLDPNGIGNKDHSLNILKNKDILTHKKHLRQYESSDKLSYVSWHEWAEKQVKRGYIQKKCPVCNLYAIWVKNDKK